MSLITFQSESKILRRQTMAIGLICINGVSDPGAHLHKKWPPYLLLTTAALQDIWVRSFEVFLKRYSSCTDKP